MMKYRWMNIIFADPTFELAMGSWPSRVSELNYFWKKKVNISCPMARYFSPEVKVLNSSFVGSTALFGGPEPTRYPPGKLKTQEVPWLWWVYGLKTFFWLCWKMLNTNELVWSRSAARKTPPPPMVWSGRLLPRLPSQMVVPPPGSPAPCNVASSVCASTREIEGRSFNVAPSPSVCASVQVQEKIL